MDRDISYLPVLFHRLQKKMMDEHEGIMTSYDLTKRHIPFLMILGRNKEGLTQQEISEMIKMDKAHTSRTLRDLEQRGYVKKLGDSTYKNKYIVTKKAEDARDAIKENNQLMLKKVLSVLTDEELDVFENIVKKLTKTL